MGGRIVTTFKLTAAAACAAVALWSAAWADEAKGLTLAEFNRLHKELTGKKEAWQELPWHLSILSACEQAAKEKKPVYMLCRSGHPLGCV